MSPYKGEEYPFFYRGLAPGVFLHGRESSGVVESREECWGRRGISSILVFFVGVPRLGGAALLSLPPRLIKPISG